MSDQLIVLGWDALDSELVTEFGLGGRFGDHMTTIETFNNPVIGKPHTMEVWPSMVTGEPRSEHGIWAVDESDGVEWSNPLLSTAAPVARSLLPQSAVTWLGARLRERGAALDALEPDYYADEGVETVFDRVDGQAISIPNYYTDHDQRHALDSNRDRVWAELSVDRSPENAVRPTVDAATVYDVLGRELGQRLGQTLQAIQRGEPLVWTWFGALDTVGHMNPAVDAPLQRDWYQTAAAVTETIVEFAPADATVLSVSDHGLQDGKHTEYATLCSDSAAPVREIASVLDVAPWLIDEAPTGRRGPASSDATDVSEVQEQLADLGYV